MCNSALPANTISRALKPVTRFENGNAERSLNCEHTHEAVYMAANHHRSSKSPMKKLKKNAGKAMRAVGDAIDNVSYMMK